MIDLSSPTPLASALSALAFICALALLYALSFLFRRGAKKEAGGGLFEGFIASIRWLDRALVHGFSWVIGTRYRQKYLRLPILLCYFLGLTAASVFLPWPYGLSFVGLGVFSIFIVFRHWSRDEDEAIAGIAYHRKDIKIDGTLGSEVLLAVAFLFVFAPTAFAQLQAHGVGFTLAADAGPFTFLLYTLIETVKAGSLVDYYDLYADRIGFERIGTPTDPSNWAKATIMGYRLSLNLLLLAAIKRLFDIAKRRAEGADLRALAQALRQTDAERQSEAIAKLKDFALQGRGNARDLLETVAEPRQSEHLSIVPETRFAAAGALLDYATQRGGVSALYAAADGYRGVMQDGFDRETEPKRWRAAAHNLGTTLVQLGQQIGDAERLKEAAALFDQLVATMPADTPDVARLNPIISQANVMADLAMMTGERTDLERSVEQYKIALETAVLARDPAKIAMLNANLGATLADLAEIDSNQTLIREAIAAYKFALNELSKSDDAETWSMAQNNLANALADLGHWTSDTTHLDASLEAHAEALSARPKKGAPLLWAMSQTNLANALTRYAKLEDDAARLRTAIEHYRAAQSVYQREEFPRDWSWAEASLANAYIDLGQMTEAADAFETALTYCDGAIGGYASARMPAKQAWVQGLKGNALIGLKRFDAAIEAFEAALTWQTYALAGDDWVMSVNNLAACLHKEGKIDRAVQFLEAALCSAPDEAKLSSTLSLLREDVDETAAEMDHTDGPDAGETVVQSDGRATIKVRIIDVKQHDIDEGQYLDSTTLDWTLEIDGQLYRYRVTREEYIEEDGQGKGSGYRIIDLNDENKIVCHTLWGEWMGVDRGPEFSSWFETEDWWIGDYDGAKVFWAIDDVVTDIWMTSYWDVDHQRSRERLLDPEGFELNTADLVDAPDP